jgi:hypothetical protein
MPWDQEPAEINYHFRPRRDYAADAVARVTAKIDAIFADARTERIKARLKR